MAFIPLLPLLSTSSLTSTIHPTCTRRLRRPLTTPCMSGVNGGIDYEIDLSTLPTELASRIRYVQQGPDSPTELIRAAETIANASSTYQSVLPVMVDMLGFNNPVAASICISSLANAGSSAIPSLLTGVAAFNYSVNAYALRAIAKIGDPSTADVCIACASKGPIPNVRRAACKALSALRFTDKTQTYSAFCTLLNLMAMEPDWGVRYASVVAIEQFHAIDLLDYNVITCALNVLNATAIGKIVSKDTLPEIGDGVVSAEPSMDPVVGARAKVALEEFTKRLEAANISVGQRAPIG